MSVNRSHFRDEEPDVDERDPGDQYDAEVKFGEGHCERCGVEGHRGRTCPTVNLLTLKASA